MDRLLDTVSVRLRLELGPVGGTRAAAVEQLAAILQQLSEEGWIDYGWTQSGSSRRL
jgi:hypothetical protein